MLYSGSAHGDGDGPVWMSNLHCGGFEHALDECAFFGLNHSSVPFKCDADHDAGVKCANIDTPAPANSATAKKAIEAGAPSAPAAARGWWWRRRRRRRARGARWRRAARRGTERDGPRLVDAAGGGVTRSPSPGSSAALGAPRRRWRRSRRDAACRPTPSRAARAAAAAAPPPRGAARGRGRGRRRRRRRGGRHGAERLDASLACTRPRARRARRLPGGGGGRRARSRRRCARACRRRCSASCARWRRRRWGSATGRSTRSATSSSTTRRSLRRWRRATRSSRTSRNATAQLPPAGRRGPREARRPRAVRAADAAPDQHVVEKDVGPADGRAAEGGDPRVDQAGRHAARLGAAAGPGPWDDDPSFSSATGRRWTTRRCPTSSWTTSRFPTTRGGSVR